MIAASVVIARRIRHFRSGNGFIYILAAAFFYAGIVIAYKQIFLTSNAVSLTFFVAFLIPAKLRPSPR